MDIRQTVLGEIAIRSGQELASIDLGVLIRRLILFDRVIVKSFRLRELPLLVRAFGKTGIQELLASGVLQLSCEFTSIITDIHLNGVRSEPAEHFTFGIVSAVNRDGDLRKELLRLQSVTGLKNIERNAIEQATWNSLVRPPDTFGTDLLRQVDVDLRTNSPSLKAGILDQLSRERGQVGSVISPLEIHVDEPRERVFHIKTRIAKDFGLSPEETHLLLQRSVTAVVNLNHRLAEMQAYSALTGFLECEAALLFGKLAGIISPQNPTLAEEQFKRVIEVAEVPDFKPGQRIDVEKLMKIRDSSECRDFRRWLSTAEDISDDEIRAQAGGMRNKLASLTGSSGGKVVRLAATTLIGNIPVAGLVLGPTAGAVDSFLVDRVLPQSGIFAFLTDMYPSLFSSP
ncbi:MAG: hypothetical protein ABSB30_15735 [Terracidiphilus sp.]